MTTILYDYLLVGSGLFSAIFARQAKMHGKRCLIIEKRTHSGGNIYCNNKSGINIHQYGAHIFHTDDEVVWQYVNRFCRFNNFINSPLANYKGKYYNLPFNMNTFYQLWGTATPAEALAKIEEQRKRYAHIEEPANLEEQALTLCGEDIYNCFIKEYTEKQWGRPATQLPAFIIKRIPFRFVYNNNYFNDRYQGIPVGGYNVLIDKLLEGIEVRCNTNYFDNREYFDSLAGKVLFTGCIDEFFGYEFGKLDYRSLTFEETHLDIPDFQGNAVVNYNDKETPFTRIIEHKHFEFGNQPSTVVTKEYPAAFTPGSEPYYPVNDEKNMAILKKYQQRSRQYPKFLFGGRLAQYAYYDMDDTIIEAFKLAKQEFNILSL